MEKKPRRAAGLGSALLAAQGVLQTADGILYLSGGLVRLSFRFQLALAGDLAGHFLDGSLGLLGRALDPILVHICAFRWGCASSTPAASRSSSQPRRSPVRERTSSCPANWRAGSPKTKAFLLREEPGRSTSSRNWSVARVISVLALRQYENALSQINKGIGVSVGSYFFASRAAISARIQEIRRMGLEPSADAASALPQAHSPARRGQRPQVH